MDPLKRANATKAYQLWWKCSQSISNKKYEYQGRRSDLDVCLIRESLADFLKGINVTRPIIPNVQYLDKLNPHDMTAVN